MVKLLSNVSRFVFSVFYTIITQGQRKRLCKKQNLTSSCAHWFDLLVNQTEEWGCDYDWLMDGRTDDCMEPRMDGLSVGLFNFSRIRDGRTDRWSHGIAYGRIDGWSVRFLIFHAGGMQRQTGLTYVWMVFHFSLFLSSCLSIILYLPVMIN